jgi:hypothetical protein
VTKGAIAYWVLVVVTLAIYAVMLVWTLPTIAGSAGGLAPFDMRPGGYSFDEAKAFLGAITGEGKRLYLDVQQRLDLVYPALYGATLFFAIAFLTPRSWGAWKWPLAATALPVPVFDYLENASVHGLLIAGADGVTPESVAVASRWTMLKSWATTVAMVILLALLLVWATTLFRARFRRA